MTLNDLQTIVAIMHNDCPAGTVEAVHVVNSRYSSQRGEFVRDGTVPGGVVVAVVWHRDGHDSQTIGRFLTLNSGFPADVELKTLDAGKVGHYLTMLKWTMC